MYISIYNWATEAFFFYNKVGAYLRWALITFFWLQGRLLLRAHLSTFPVYKVHCGHLFKVGTTK